MSVLRKCPVIWANVIKPNVKFQPKWDIVALLTKDQARQLKDEASELGGNIKFRKETFNGEEWLGYQFKRNLVRADGEENSQPPVMDAKKEPFTDLVGNGSICNIQYSLVSYKNKFGKGITSDLKGVQVLKHVPYIGGDGSEFEDEDGFDSQIDQGPKATPKIQEEAFDDDLEDPFD